MFMRPSSHPGWLRTLLFTAAMTSTVAASAPALAFGSGIHTRATRSALPFLAGDVLDTIVSGNLDEDEGAEADLAERHAQNCRFRDSAGYINMRYSQVVDALHAPRADDPNRAARLFGHLLHGMQDFYSHSNWIPQPPQGLGIRDRLLDAGLGPWAVPAAYSNPFGDLAIVEGDPPAGIDVRLPSDAAGRVSSAVPIVRDRRIFATPGDGRADTGPVGRSETLVDGRVYRGLMTSGAPRHPGDQHCPPVAESCNIATPGNVCLRHGDKRHSDTSSRNFDGVGRMNLDGDGGGDWAEARHYARLQTRHEWCRLLHRSRDLDPTYIASGRLLGQWVATDSGTNTPHVPGTPCARGPARRTLVEISATPGAAAPAQVPFIVFRSDFTSSARTSATRQATATLRICGNPGEDIIATLVPARTAGTVFVLPVPPNAQAWAVRDNRGEFPVRFSVKATPNAC